jgi:hypothetical protein
MAIGPMSFKRISHEEANPFMTGALKSQEFAKNALMTPQQLQAAMLANIISQAQAKYAEPNAKADLEYKQAQTPYLQSQTQGQNLQNQYYPQDITSQINQRNAQTGLIGEQTMATGLENEFNKKANPYKLMGEKFKGENPREVNNPQLSVLADLEKYFPDTDFGGQQASGGQGQPANPMQQRPGLPNAFNQSLSPKQMAINKMLLGTPYPVAPLTPYEKTMQEVEARRVGKAEDTAKAAVDTAQTVTAETQKVYNAYNDLWANGVPNRADLQTFERANADALVAQFAKYQGTGAISHNDLENIQKMVPGAFTSRESMEKFMANAQKVEARTIENQQKLNAGIASGMPLNQVQQDIAKYNQVNPVFKEETPEVKQAIARIADPKEKKAIKRLQKEGKVIEKIMIKGSKHYAKIYGEDGWEDLKE